MVPYDDDDNNDDKFDGPPEYDYCRPNSDPDFSSYKFLISMVYSNCDANQLAYHTCKHIE